MEYSLPNNTNLILEIFDRLTKEVTETDAGVRLSIGKFTENICVELLHHSNYYEYGNRTLTFFSFSSEEKLMQQERIAMDVLHNNGLIEREANL